MLEALTEAFTILFTIQHLTYMVVGVLLGLVVGVFPGLGGIVGLSLCIPFLHGMDPVSALAMLVGLVAVIPTSDTFTSVLMGIPGSSASQATVLDGFPLAKKGEAARALGAAFSASLFGGLFGAFILTFFVLIARPVILFFTTAELFMLAVLGISMVGVLSGQNIWKGVASCGLGLVIGAIGGAPATGEWRMTFDINYLADGIPLVVVGLGVFAFPEVVDLLRKSGTIAKGATLGKGWLHGLQDMFRNRWLCLRCAGIGTLIGAIPGLGGSVVDWIAYGHVVQTSKDKSKFGTGDIRGVLAPESANNAKEGGGLIPTLLFGIPGSGSMAVFIGGLILIGLEPGPRLLTAELPTTYTIVWTLAFANVVGAGLCLFLSPVIARLTTIRYHLLAPFMLMVISFAAFQASRDLMDFIALVLIGLLGVGMKRFGWSRPALLIGFVLADQVEVYLYQAIQFHEWSFLTRPGVIVLAIITVISVFLGARNKPQAEEEVHDVTSVHAADLRPQLIFSGFVGIVFLYALYDSTKHSTLGSVFTMGVGAVMLVAAIFVIKGVWQSGGEQNTFNYDEERPGVASFKVPEKGIWYFLIWIIGLLGLTALTGFFIALNVFFVAFLRLEAKATWVRTVVLTLMADAILMFLSWLMTLDLPWGLLQHKVIDLPWPIGSI
ncbi:MAG: tripartite tricarboxylate transporter permease [Rhodospirillales bacterium]|nr:tripartite tricarboxylate transporter permease [Rhodospirillales bacterium]